MPSLPHPRKRRDGDMKTKLIPTQNSLRKKTERGESNARRPGNALAARFFMLATASVSVLGYEKGLCQPAIGLWNDTHAGD